MPDTPDPQPQPEPQPSPVQGFTLHPTTPEQKAACIIVGSVNSYGISRTLAYGAQAAPGMLLNEIVSAVLWALNMPETAKTFLNALEAMEPRIVAHAAANAVGYHDGFLKAVEHFEDGHAEGAA